MFVTTKSFLFNWMTCHDQGSLELKKLKIIFFAEINDREKLSKTLNKYITVLDYTDKTPLAILVASSGVFLWSFNTVIGTPVGITSASISLVFLIGNKVVKMFLKIIGRKN